MKTNRKISRLMLVFGAVSASFAVGMAVGAIENNPEYQASLWDGVFLSVLVLIALASGLCAILAPD